MNLPDLPRRLRQKEADFGVRLIAWLDKNPMYTASMEIKDTRGKDRFMLSEITPKQIAYGMAIKGDRGVLIRVQGVNGEPDYVYMRSEPAYVIVKFPKAFCVIDVETMLLEKSKRKSLTLERASEISIKTVKTG